MDCIRCTKKLTGHQTVYCSSRCRAAQGVQNWRHRTKKRAVEYLGGKCMQCGYKKCLAALTFHHREPEKKGFMISRSAYANCRAWEKIEAELKKCDLLCMNCHAERHAE